MLPRSVFFIGVGGSGMAPLALFAARAGVRVAGADPGVSAARRRELESAGIAVFAEHNPALIDDYEAVVYSSAIASDHPDRQRAAGRAAAGQLALMHRMDFLSALMEDAKLAFCVAGTHGKTSTSSLIGWALTELGLDPHIVVGGKPLYLPDGFRRGGGLSAIYETDESDGSFLRARAPHRLALNIDHDHLEHYGDFGRLCRAFEDFLAAGETIALNYCDPELARIGRALARSDSGFAGRQLAFAALAPGEPAPAVPETVTYYEGRFEGQSDRLRLRRGAEDLGVIELKLPGRHFASNAAGAVALLSGALEPAGRANPERLFAALASFPGVERRVEYLGERSGVAVFDDYGHHPTELRAVLTALRSRANARGGRLFALFQPHRYTRTASLYAEFAAALALADQVFLWPIYPSGEAPLPGVSASLIAQAYRSAAHAGEADRAELVELETGDAASVFAGARAGDVVALLGAGDISSRVRAFL